MHLAGPVVAVCGTRPEFIKIAPVLRELNRREIPFHLVLTGQHVELIDGLASFFEIQRTISLEVTREGSNLNTLLSKLLEQLNIKLADWHPALTLVQGDTTSALAGAISSFHLGIPVVHLEAGLRTGDKLNPFPEEANRKLIGQVANLHLTPTSVATSNLLAEGIREQDIVEIGNTVVDATEFALSRRPRTTDRVGHYFAITVHRRESWDRDIKQILRAIRILAKEHSSIDFRFVMHANPSLQTTIKNELATIENVDLLLPMKYPEFIAFLSGASMILTDSGGIQEEAPTLGVPTVILRDVTERPEAVSAGACRIGGTKTDEIVRVVSAWMTEIEAGNWQPPNENPFGDGLSAVRAVNSFRRFEASNPDSQEE